MVQGSWFQGLIGGISLLRDYFSKSPKFCWNFSLLRSTPPAT